MYTLATFIEKSASSDVVFADPILQSLHLVRHKNWVDSHNIAQDIHSKWAYMVHGYLHRLEGDEWNASYWYRQAKEDNFAGSLDEEWEYIAEKYLRTFAP